MQIYLLASLVLFAVISYTYTSVLKSFQQEVQVWNDNKVEISVLESCNLLKLWKRRLDLIWKTMESLDNCFTWTLLLCVSYLFTSFVTQSFYLFRGVMYDNDSVSKIMVDGCFLTFLIIDLSIICFPVDDRQHQVLRQIELYRSFPILKM